MAESKIRDENYFQISGWMLNRLGLKGVALQVFAIIYGFSQNGESEFTGSLQYLMNFTNASKPTIIKALKSLVEMGYILRSENFINGVQFNTYKVNLQVVKKLYSIGKETLPPPSKETLLTTSKETLPNNKTLDNKSLNNKDKKKRGTYQRIADMYNEICISFPRTRSLSAARKKAIGARLKTYTETDFRILFEKAEASDFLKGKNTREWRATFDWLIQDANMAKVLDGNYDKKEVIGIGGDPGSFGESQRIGNYV